MDKNIDIPKTNIVTAKKRGRKSKKELEEIALQKLQQSSIKDNITVVIEESNIDIEMNESNINELLVSDIDNDMCDNNVSNSSLQKCEDEKPIAKKRGRKPKGGKIIQQIVPLHNNKEPKPNVILHLKCSLKDLQTSLLQDNEIQSFHFQSTNQLKYDIINNNTNNCKFFNKLEKTMNDNNENYNDDHYNKNYDDNKSITENDTREIWKKLKVLEYDLHVNNISDKKSACFWCTYEFDNPPVYIPKHFIKDSYHVYGCFCSPECGTAYLMQESIDSSSKFERYHLMNHIYSKIYDYKKNIKPAPNPYYMLEKYYGNLSIQEYRSLLRNERLFLVVDKPLTRILPELHEDNDDFIINNKIIPSNNYQIKKKLQKKQTKNNILSERFGLAQQ